MELEARGRAASIIEDGNANIAVFQRMAEEFSAAGPNAKDVLLLNMLPDLVEQITDTVSGIDIDKITVIDGDGNGGAVGGVAGQMPGAVISIVEQIENATGVNILNVLAKDEDWTPPPASSPQLGWDAPEGNVSEDAVDVDSAEA